MYLRLLSDDLKILKGRTIYTLVGVKNDEEKIEGIARALMFKMMACDSGASDYGIIFMDMGSEDKTEEIIRKLEKDNMPVSLVYGNRIKYDSEMSVVD